MTSRRVASLAVWIALVLITLGFVILAPPVCLVIRLTARIPWPRLARWCIWSYGRAVARMLGLFFPVLVHGRPGRIGDPPCIFVLNHASFLDLFFITLAAPPDSVCLARQWPFSVPLFGPVMRLGQYVNVERLSVEELLDRAQELLRQGVSLAIFPEGTRSRTGAMGRFHSGAFRLSIETGIPVRPVRIEGSGRILPPGVWKMRRGALCVNVLEDVAPAPYTGEVLGHVAMRRHTRERISTACMPSPATF